MKPVFEGISRKNLTSWILTASGLLGFLLIWELTGRSGILPSAMIPVPSRIPAAFLRETALPGNALIGGLWGEKVLQSLTHYLRGVTGGIFLGIFLGILTGTRSVLRNLLRGVVRLLRPIPPLAWIPFAIIWFGISHTASAFIIGVGVFWINYLNTFGAVEHSDPGLNDVARVFGFGAWLPRLVLVTLPQGLPGILTGIRTSLGMGWMAVVASELFGIPGLGERMNQAAGLLATDVVLVYMLTIAGLYSLFDVLFTTLKRRVLKWRPQSQ